jgi:hypothetical protein
VIKAIRSINADNIILAGSPKWDQDIQLPAADPIKGLRQLNIHHAFFMQAHTNNGCVTEQMKLSLKGYPFLFPNMQEWKLLVMALSSYSKKVQKNNRVQKIV